MGKFLIPVSLDDGIAHQLGLQDFSAERMPYPDALNSKRWINGFVYDNIPGQPSGFRGKLLYSHKNGHLLKIHEMTLIAELALTDLTYAVLCCCNSAITQEETALDAYPSHWLPVAPVKILGQFSVNRFSFGAIGVIEQKFSTPLIVPANADVYIWSLIAGPYFRMRFNFLISEG